MVTTLERAVVKAVPHSLWRYRYWRPDDNHYELGQGYRYWNQYHSSKRLALETVDRPAGIQDSRSARSYGCQTFPGQQMQWVSSAVARPTGPEPRFSLETEEREHHFVGSRGTFRGFLSYEPPAPQELRGVGTAVVEGTPNSAHSQVTVDWNLDWRRAVRSDRDAPCQVGPSKPLGVQGWAQV